jgi:hypothetical protein
MNTDNTDAIAAAVDYWTGLLEIEEKREAFKAALLPLVEQEWRQEVYGIVGLCVDYDPNHLLLGALHAIGIECRGCFFSADGIFPRKHRSVIEEGAFRVGEGYGAPFRDVFVRAERSKEGTAQ